MRNQKVVILKKENKIVSLLFQDNRLLRANAEEEDDHILGSIYIAKVKNVVRNIHAAFVEIKPGFPCFLGLDGMKEPLLVNRPYDGRILQEDEIVVQVYKEAVKTKPPAVTCSPSLDGRYCVVGCAKTGITYSNKLSLKAKQRLREALAAKAKEDADFMLEEYRNSYGIIIRTNAKELGEDITPLCEEIRQLTEKLTQLLAAAPHRTCYTRLYEKPPLYLRNLRDMYTEQYEEIVTDEEEIFRQVEAYARENPDFPLKQIRLYQDDRLPLYKLYAVEARLGEALGKKVWLKSGGYLVIEPTEALTVIDVNSGKMSAGKIPGGKETDEIYYRINMEAADEIALQLTLRNLSGIIIVDFINMKEEEQRKKLMAHLGDRLKQDPVKTRLMDITSLGLVEITRMKVNKPLKEQFK